MPANELSVRWMFVKAILFVVIVGLATAALLLANPTWSTAACVAALCWASSRAYYFAFYVVQRWVDPTYRFTGLTSFVVWLVRHRRRARGDGGVR